MAAAALYFRLRLRRAPFGASSAWPARSPAGPARLRDPDAVIALSRAGVADGSAELAVWASLSFGPAAAARNLSCAQVLHSIAAF
jgi:hypothetical protein